MHGRLCRGEQRAMNASFRSKSAWVSACVVMGMSLSSGARAGVTSGAVPAPSAETRGGSRSVPRQEGKAPVAQALAQLAPAAASTLVSAGAAATALAAPPPAAPADTPDEPSTASGSSRGLRIGGTGELLGWANVAGNMRQPIFAMNSSNAQFLLTHVH